MQRKALGKGLGALIPLEQPENLNNFGTNTSDIPIVKIFPGKAQPRKNFDEGNLQELVDSVKEKGILQPIIVQKEKNGYEIVAGERRWRAAKLAGLEKIPAIVMNLSDLETLEVALIENIHRQDLNPIEEANVYHKLSTKFDLTQDEISKRVGKDRSSIANFLRLLKLPPEIKKDIAENSLTMGHARALLSLQYPHEQLKLRDAILKNSLSVREVESKIKNQKQKTQTTKTEKKDIFLTKLEDDLKKSLGTKVLMTKGKKGGKIIINFYSDEELERILKVFSIQ